jgi:hypothetical protein
MRGTLCFAVFVLLSTAIANAAQPREDERTKLLDAALAESLKDPASAQQYSVGAFRSCDGLTANPMGAYADGCMCYAVNAKNSYGGYTGVHYGVATFLHDHATIRDQGELAFDFKDACNASGMTKRDPKLLVQ